MTTLTEIFLFAHLLGMAAIVGGFFATLKSDSPNAAMVWGGRAQLLTGLALVGIAESQKWQIDHMWVGAKLVIAFIVVALLEVAAGKAKKGQHAKPLVHAAAGLAILNVIIAVFWH